MHHERHARALGERAKTWGEQEKCAIIAVLFHDKDGTRSSSRTLWQEKYEAMKRGFNTVEDYGLGVPMLPNPKSEAWLLCARKEQPYVNCSPLERESGNDSSPNALKHPLVRALAQPYDNDEMTRWVQDDHMDTDRIDMPSFCCFKKDLHTALETVGCAPLTPPDICD